MGAKVETVDAYLMLEERRRRRAGLRQQQQQQEEEARQRERERESERMRMYVRMSARSRSRRRDGAPWRRPSQSKTRVGLYQRVLGYLSKCCFSFVG